VSAARTALPPTHFDRNKNTCYFGDRTLGRLDNFGTGSRCLLQKNRVFNLSVKSVIVRHKNQLLQACGLLCFKHGLSKFLLTFGVDPVRGLVEDTESKSAELLDHGQSHRERELGLFST